MIGAVITITAIALLWWLGSEGAPLDEAIAKVGPWIVLIVAIYPIVWLWKFLSLPARLDQEQQTRLDDLERTIEPRLSLAFGPTIPGCRSPTRFHNGMPVTFFRIKVERRGLGVARQCVGHLVDVHKNEQATSYSDTLQLTWAPAEMAPLSIDLMSQVPAFLDVCFVTKAGQMRLGTADRKMPFYLADLFSEQAKYEMKVAVSCADGCPEFIRIIVRLGNSDTDTTADRL